MNVLIRALLTLALLGSTAPTRAVEPGELAPEVAGKLMGSEQFRRLSELRGRVVILDFWASWCGPCQQSMPELDTLHQHLQRDGLGEKVSLLGVNVDEDSTRAKQFLAAHPVRYPVIADLLGIGLKRYAPRKLPATYLLDRNGRVAFIYYGYGQDYGAALEAKMREVLAADTAN